MFKESTENNAAFIDGQNLYMGPKASGFNLDYVRFRKYLGMKYGVRKAYLYLGYIKKQEKLYYALQGAGFDLVFKEVATVKDEKPKGNVDVLLAVDVMERLGEFDKAVLVTSDGDFVPLVESLQKRDKFLVLISPRRVTCSRLLQKAVKNKARYVESVIHKMKKHSADT